MESGDSRKSRDGSWDGVFRDESHDCNHGQTAVVELTGALLFHGGSIDTREVNWRENYGRKLATLHVVLALGLRGDLSDEDRGQDLGFAYETKRTSTFGQTA